MKCPKCNSENVQVQSQEYKPKLTLPIVMVCGGFGLMFFGIGAIVGVIVGLIIAAIVNAVIPQTYRPVMVCQQCGFVGTNTTMTHVVPNSLFCTDGESNLVIVRRSNSFGSVCKLGIKIDNYAPFEIGDNESRHLKIEQGAHTITYYQVNGMGKAQRKGVMNITVGESCRTVEFEFQRVGLNTSVL